MVLGPKHVVSFGPKYDWLPEIGPNLVVFLGPKRDVNAMAKSTAIMEMRRHDPTNPHWAQFGEAQGEWKRILQNLNPVAKMHRKRWMHQIAYTPMPTGPYPVYVVGCGWMKFYVDSKDYQICYCPRPGDLNLSLIHI